MNGHQSWTTRDELRWLSRLGAHSAVTRILPPAVMLAGALAGCQRRADWGAIDRAEVMQELTRRLLRGYLEQEAR